MLKRVPHYAQSGQGSARAEVAEAKRGGIHALCCACASHLLEAGTGFPTIRGLLGHALLDTMMQWLVGFA